MDKNMIYRQYA